jgi:hypothetical protein
MTTREYETLSAYLVNHDWLNSRTSETAALWVRGNSEMAVSLEIHPDSLAWEDVIRRIASGEERPPSKVENELEFSTFDVARFRIANGALIGRTAPLHSGLVLVSSAYSMLRASATTAQRLRSQIGSSYSKVGDDYMKRARIGHTEEGSFVVPVLFAHDEPDLPTATPIAGTETMLPESPQRRIVRTLAQTLDTYQKRIIEPAKEPRQADLLPVLASGGSRELFAGLEKILFDPSVAEFETQFSWGVQQPAPGNAPSRVVIPSEARELVKRTVELLTEPQRKPLQIFTGPIVAIIHDVGDLTGQIAVQAPSANGRPSRIYMSIRATQLTDLHEWMNGAITVTVQGVVERLPGRPLQLQGIVEPTRLDASFLTTNDDSPTDVSS